MVETLPLQIPMVPGGMEMVVILLIAVLLFGANKIPKLARSTGQAMGEFQKGRQEVEEELQEMQEPLEMDEEESATGTDTSSTDTTSTDTSSSSTESETSTN
jgi:sec-independent protein translocase protein TatA